MKFHVAILKFLILPKSLDVAIIITYTKGVLVSERHLLSSLIDVYTNDIFSVAFNSILKSSTEIILDVQLL